MANVKASQFLLGTTIDTGQFTHDASTKLSNPQPRHLFDGFSLSKSCNSLIYMNFLHLLQAATRY